MGKRPKRSVKHPPQSSRRTKRRTAYAFVTQMSLGSIALGGFGVGVYLSVTGANLTEARVLDELTYQRVEQLRQTMAVTNEDLALMGVPPEQAEVVIQSVLAWSDQNSERLATAERAVRNAESELRRARRALQSGQVQRDTPTASYEQLSAAVDEAKAGRRAVLTELETQLASRLTAAETDWTAAKLNAGWVSDAMRQRADVDTLRTYAAMRRAGDGGEDEATLTPDVAAYRTRLDDIGALEAVSRTVYLPPPVVLPVNSPDVVRP